MARYPLPILFRDARLVAVNKPAGLLVDAVDEFRDTCVTRLQRQLGLEVHLPRGKGLQPCHDLDRGASGVLLLTYAALPLQLQERYWAVVRGFMSQEESEIDLPVEGQGALSRVRVLERFSLPFRVGRYPTCRYSLVEVRPLTRRHHQVRRHLKLLGHPVVGDTRHGDNQHNRWLSQVLGWNRLALAAVELGFDHPDGRRVNLACPLSLRMQALLESLRVLSQEVV